MASNTIVRFGRRITLPSTVQILHDYRVFAEEREVRELCAAELGLSLDASWSEIVVRRQHAAPAITA
jgi:hypothetical protein